MKRALLAVFSLFTLVSFANAQEQASVKQQADMAYNKLDFYHAGSLYFKLAQKKDPDVKIMQRLANCYRQINDNLSAEAWLGRALESGKADTITYLNYAEALLINQKYEQAKDQFIAYGKMINDTLAIKPKVLSCDSAALWTKYPSDFTVANFGPLNSASSDWGTTFFGPGVMLFTSDRQADPWQWQVPQSGWTGNSYFKTYMSVLSNGRVDSYNLLSKGINTLYPKEFHEGPMLFNANQDTVYVTVSSIADRSKLSTETIDKQNLYSRRLEVLVAYRKDGEWQPMTRLPFNDVNKYSVAHPALSRDHKVIYFTSNMPGGYGGMDIWYSELKDGQWGTPVNCGPNINTAYDDAFPTIGLKNELYFASKGHVGMGGYDVFVAVGSKSNFGRATNMKSPINSTQDDFWFLVENSTKGYFSSNRKGGKGDDDIYIYNYVKPKPVLSARVRVFDSETNETLDSATLTFRDLFGNGLGRVYTSNQQPSFFKMRNKMNYTFNVSKRGYYPVEKNVATPDSVTKLNDTIMVDIPMTMLKTNAVFVLNNILYDLDKSDIRKDAALELDKLVEILLDNPRIKVELSSHTDSRGNDKYNLGLSQRRAESAVKYLVSRGIAAGRLVPKGYGESKLLNECGNGVECTEEQHQLNRRTEFKILSTQ